MSDQLDALSDAELSEVFSSEVAGRGKWSGDDRDLPRFATSVDALLPFMEQQRLSILRTGYGPPQWLVYSQNLVGIEACDVSLARAICIVLIEILRSEMETDRARHRSEHPLGTDI